MLSAPDKPDGIHRTSGSRRFPSEPAASCTTGIPECPEALVKSSWNFYSLKEHKYARPYQEVQPCKPRRGRTNLAERGSVEKRKVQLGRSTSAARISPTKAFFTRCNRSGALLSLFRRKDLASQRRSWVSSC